METNPELGRKDCHVCNRRRIRCDRRLPTCSKCEKRGLTCSGYGVILKWDQGIASRGNLKGKSLPVQPPATTLMAPSSLDRHSRPMSLEARDGEPGNPLTEAMTGLGHVDYSIPTPLVSHQLQNSDNRRLLHYYDHVIAPNMTSLDYAANPWRHIIIPLALQSPSLLSAILAFSVKHMNAISHSNSKQNISTVSSVSSNLEQTSMKLLAREIEEFTKIPPGNNFLQKDNDMSSTRSDAILATMLVLCNVETVWPDSPVWQVHLNAARTVMESINRRRPAEHATSTFLEQELFVAATFASTTSFTPSPSDFTPPPSDPSGWCSTIFIEFLKVLQIVTRLERQAVENPSLLPNPEISPVGLKKLFENARSKTLGIGTRYEGQDGYLHLSRTANCLYHAGLIYSYRALLKTSFELNPPSEKNAGITASKTELFQHLSLVSPSKPTFAQDLVWPLFIAGTEASSKFEKELVVTGLQKAISGTGFSNCQRALEFLEALWGKRGDDRDFDWIGFAREWTVGTKRGTFAVF